MLLEPTTYARPTGATEDPLSVHYDPNRKGCHELSHNNKVPAWERMTTDEMQTEVLTIEEALRINANSTLPYSYARDKMEERLKTRLRVLKYHLEQAIIRGVCNV